MKNKIIVSSLFLLFLLVSCQPSQTTCRYEAPSAIFTDIQQIEPISFSLNGQTGIEKIRIPSLHLELELMQSGCENLKQEFRFILDGTYPQETSAAECAQDIATILYNISTFDKKLSDFSDWAEMLFKQSTNISYENMLLIPETGIRASIIKQHLPTKTILTLVIE